ncbi:hypothetical protein [Paenibacillus cremeus]|uniref:Uncharacterized protein n=1 Tax=Paenibacillus cremeus TaxID=2163881 RepID=A0A559K592_9BACL|nr:hypothetical protein [Paenibacillus cremeus]TVY07263.1 hypothetical protein FPZ49_24845 [Paenibacillus cremeus]
MFDPTIFDNLKVVLEGGLYDLDAEELISVIGRVDQIDLASMSRTFGIAVKLREGKVKAELRLSSGLLDFAAELRGVSVVGAQPGAELSIEFELPADPVGIGRFDAIHRHLHQQWGSEAAIGYEERSRFTTQPAPRRTIFIATVAFQRKVDENHIADLDSLLEHIVESLELLERQV